MPPKNGEKNPGKFPGDFSSISLYNASFSSSVLYTGYITHKLTLTKGDTEIYESFRIVLDNNLYKLVSIANSIIDWEASYGDVDPSTYMGYYHGLKVEKLNQEEGSTIYILTDKGAENKFQFASRSVAWPIGY